MIDHGYWFAAGPPPGISAQDGVVVAALGFGVAAVCAVLLGLIL
jgi:hypothetical protein